MFEFDSLNYSDLCGLLHQKFVIQTVTEGETFEQYRIGDNLRYIGTLKAAISYGYFRSYGEFLNLTEDLLYAYQHKIYKN